MKELLENIYLDVKKNTWFVVWLSFRVPDNETFVIRELFKCISALTSPAKQPTLKSCILSQKTKIKKKSDVFITN
jgi:hypothetical protein